MCFFFVTYESILDINVFKCISKIDQDHGIIMHGYDSSPEEADDPMYTSPSFISDFDSISLKGMLSNKPTSILILLLLYLILNIV